MAKKSSKIVPIIGFELARELKSLTSAAHVFNQQLSRSSTLSNINGRFGYGERFVLNRFELKLNINLKKDEKIKFFLQKKESLEEEDLIMKNEISLALKPFSDKREDFVVINPDVAQCHFEIPSFLDLDKTSKILKVKLVDKFPASVLEFHLGEKPKIGSTDFILDGRKISKKDLKNVDQFFFYDFIRTLRFWRERENTTQKKQALISLPKSDFKTILEQISASFIFVNYPEEIPEKRILNGIWEKDDVYYKSAHFYSKVFLKLDEDGNLIEKSKKEHFQMLFDIKAHFADNVPQLTIQLYPPDFLISGAIYEELWASLNQVVVEKLAKKLDVEKDFVEAILKDAPNNKSIIFRVNRKKNIDTNLFFIERENDSPIIFLAKLEKTKLHGKNQWEIKKNSVKGMQKNNGDTDLKKIFINYCCQLAWHTNNWLKHITTT